MNLFSLSMLIFLVSCGDDIGGADADNRKSYTIDFVAMVGAQTANCDTDFTGLGTQNTTAQLKDLRFYVSNVVLSGGGETTTLALDDDNKWQNGTVALLDFEDATGLCATSGTAETNTSIKGLADDIVVDTITFEIAIPFELNHLDVAAAEPPLDISEMYWAWAIGYRFLKVDFDVTGTAWNVHLGSHGCTSPDMMTPPTAECDRANKPKVSLDSFEPAVNKVLVDVAAMVATSDLTMNTASTAFGCQSFPNDTDDCTPVYNQFALDWATGDCVGDCAAQAVFSVK